MNKCLVGITFLIPKMSAILQETKGFTYAMAIDLNMSDYTIRVDPKAQKMCTIITMGLILISAAANGHCWISWHLSRENSGSYEDSILCSHIS